MADGLITTTSGQFLIGNAANGTEADPTGGAGGLWSGDGGNGRVGGAPGAGGAAGTATATGPGEATDGSPGSSGSTGGNSLPGSP